MTLKGPWFDCYAQINYAGCLLYRESRLYSDLVSFIGRLHLWLYLCEVWGSKMTNLGSTDDPMFVKVLTVTENIWGAKDYKPLSFWQGQGRVHATSVSQILNYVITLFSDENIKQKGFSNTTCEKNKPTNLFRVIPSKLWEFHFVCAWWVRATVKRFREQVISGHQALFPGYYWSERGWRKSLTLSDV